MGMRVRVEYTICQGQLDGKGTLLIVSKCIKRALQAVVDFIACSEILLPRSSIVFMYVMVYCQVELQSYQNIHAFDDTISKKFSSCPSLET